MHVWALNISEEILRKQVTSVTSGKWNWKPEVRSGGTLTFHGLLFHILKIFYHVFVLPTKKGN